MQIGKGDEKAAGAAERKIDQRGRDAARTGDEGLRMSTACRPADKTKRKPGARLGQDRKERMMRDKMHIPAPQGLVEMRKRARVAGKRSVPLRRHRLPGVRRAGESGTPGALRGDGGWTIAIPTGIDRLFFNSFSPPILCVFEKTIMSVYAEMLKIDTKRERMKIA